MKAPLTLLAAACLSITGLRAQEPTPAATEPPSTKELAQRLFDPQASQEQFLETTRQAGQAGIPRQQIIEAKLIWGLRRQDVAWLVKIMPELEVLAANFDPAQSAGLRSADEVRSYISYAKALKASDAGDEAVFKQEILEAVWLNPQQAQIFTQLIEQKRRAAAMAAIRVDMTLPLTTVEGEATTLGDLVTGKKALLLDFWASWCGPCMQLMPELKKKSEQLTAHGIVVAGLNKDDQEPRQKAEKVRTEQDIDFPWLIEPAERPFSRQLGIDSIPRMILLSPDGKVLYNGHPQDPNLWKALQAVEPAIKAPEA